MVFCGKKVATSTRVGMEGLGTMAQQLQCCVDFFSVSEESPTTHLVCAQGGNWLCCGNSMVEQLGDPSMHLPLSPPRAWDFLISLFRLFLKSSVQLELMDGRSQNKKENYISCSHHWN